jgi:hypothetical protein
MFQFGCSASAGADDKIGDRSSTTTQTVTVVAYEIGVFAGTEAAPTFVPNFSPPVFTGPKTYPDGGLIEVRAGSSVLYRVIVGPRRTARFEEELIQITWNLSPNDSSVRITKQEHEYHGITVPAVYRRGWVYVVGNRPVVKVQRIRCTSDGFVVGWPTDPTKEPGAKVIVEAEYDESRAPATFWEIGQPNELSGGAALRLVAEIAALGMREMQGAKTFRIATNITATPHQFWNPDQDISVSVSEHRISTIETIQRFVDAAGSAMSRKDKPTKP